MQPLRLQKASSAVGRQRRGHSREGRRTRSHPKAKALGHTKPLLLSVPSERAAHRAGRGAPQTHTKRRVCALGGSLHTRVGEHRNRADSCLQSSHLQIHPRDRVQVTLSWPPDTRARPGTRTRALLPPQASSPLGLDLCSGLPWLLSLAQTVPASEAPPPTLLPPCPLADVRNGITV